MPPEPSQGFDPHPDLNYGKAYLRRLAAVLLPGFELRQVSVIQAIRFLAEQATLHDADTPAGKQPGIIIALDAEPASTLPLVTFRGYDGTDLGFLLVLLAAHAGLLLRYSDTAAFLQRPRTPEEILQATWMHVIRGIDPPVGAKAQAHWLKAQRAILAKYPQIGVAGSGAHQTFLQGFKSSGSDHQRALAVADALFGPQHRFLTERLLVVHLPLPEPPCGFALN